MHESWLNHCWIMVESWMNHGCVMDESWMHHECVMDKSYMRRGCVMHESWMCHVWDQEEYSFPGRFRITIFLLNMKFNFVNSFFMLKKIRYYSFVYDYYGYDMLLHFNVNNFVVIFFLTPRTITPTTFSLSFSIVIWSRQCIYVLQMAFITLKIIFMTNNRVDNKFSLFMTFLYYFIHSFFLSFCITVTGF